MSVKCALTTRAKPRVNFKFRSFLEIRHFEKKKSISRNPKTQEKTQRGKITQGENSFKSQMNIQSNQSNFFKTKGGGKLICYICRISILRISIKHVFLVERSLIFCQWRIKHRESSWKNVHRDHT